MTAVWIAAVFASTFLLTPASAIGASEAETLLEQARALVKSAEGGAPQARAEALARALTVLREIIRKHALTTFGQQVLASSPNGLTVRNVELALRESVLAPVERVRCREWNGGGASTIQALFRSRVRMREWEAAKRAFGNTCYDDEARNRLRSELVMALAGVGRFDDALKVADDAPWDRADLAVLLMVRGDNTRALEIVRSLSDGFGALTLRRLAIVVRGRDEAVGRDLLQTATKLAIQNEFDSWTKTILALEVAGWTMQAEALVLLDSVRGNRYGADYKSELPPWLAAALGAIGDVAGVRAVANRVSRSTEVRALAAGAGALGEQGHHQASRAIFDQARQELDPNWDARERMGACGALAAGLARARDFDAAFEILGIRGAQTLKSCSGFKPSHFLDGGLEEVIRQLAITGRVSEALGLSTDLTGRGVHEDIAAIVSDPDQAVEIAKGIPNADRRRQRLVALARRHIADGKSDKAREVLFSCCRGDFDAEDLLLQIYLDREDFAGAIKQGETTGWGRLFTVLRAMLRAGRVPDAITLTGKMKTGFSGYDDDRTRGIWAIAEHVAASDGFAAAMRLVETHVPKDKGSFLPPYPTTRIARLHLRAGMIDAAVAALAQRNWYGDEHEFRLAIADWLIGDAPSP